MVCLEVIKELEKHRRNPRLRDRADEGEIERERRRLLKREHGSIPALVKLTTHLDGHVPTRTMPEWFGVTVHGVCHGSERA